MTLSLFTNAALITLVITLWNSQQMRDTYDLKFYVGKKGLYLD